MESNLKQNENDGSKKSIVFIVVAILLGVNVILLWQFFSKKSENALLWNQKSELVASLDSVNTEFASLKTDFGRLQEENTVFQSKLAENDSQIKEQVEKIEKLLKENAQVKSIKAELGKLKKLKNQYEERIAELEKANRELTSQNQELSTNLSSVKSKNESLTSENSNLSNKVAMGSVLKTENMSINAVKYKSSGKEVNVKKAKDAEKIKICFTLLENVVVDRGQKNIFVRILGPDKSPLSTTMETFNYNGKATVYSSKENISFDNKTQDICFLWTKGSEYSKGKYSVELYTDNNMIGTGGFELK